METLWKQVVNIVNSEKAEGKIMLLVKEEFLESALELCKKRKWIVHEEFRTYCEHQKHNGFIGKEHWHIPLDIGNIKTEALKKIFQRHFPKSQKQRYRTIRMKSMNHWINSLIYNKTDKHGHKDAPLRDWEAGYVRGKLRDLYPEIAESHKNEMNEYMKNLRNKGYGIKKKKPNFYQGSDYELSTDEGEAHETIHEADERNLSVPQLLDLRKTMNVDF